MQLRPYQSAALDAAKDYLSRCVEPCVMDLATGAGKSIIVAELAQWLHDKSGKRVLCLAPSKELVIQNREKYLATGRRASMFSASAGKKCIVNKVIFGTEKTVLNNINLFKRQFAAIIVDECHRITPTIKAIIDALREENAMLRVVGLTATPYRLGTGYIYAYDLDGNPLPETQTTDAYFNRLIYRVDAHTLIEQGYLTAPHCDPDIISGYNTDTLTLNKMGQYDAAEVEQTFVGRGRLTSAIVADVVRNSVNRKGVIIFAASIKHALEIMESLPKENSRILTGKTRASEREQLITDFKKQRFKYFVNVAVLTTGFDAPHIDHVVLMRKTESVSLLQQMVGRGLRLDDNKDDCLVSDYAENLREHCPDGDLFNPKISARVPSQGFEIEAQCEECGTVNTFAGRHNPDELPHDEYGYFTDLTGTRIANDDGVFLPAHYGRRCYGQVIKAGIAERCGYRWSVKECPECQHENDIAARFCEDCKCELVDPNEKLRIETVKIKKSPYLPSRDKVLSWHYQKWISRQGNETLRIDYTTECRSFTVWHTLRNQQDWLLLTSSLCGSILSSIDEFISIAPAMPSEIVATKDKQSGFYKVREYIK